MRTNSASYTEIATGMHYFSGGDWQESRNEIQIVADGAEATKGQHQVHFSANANSVGAVTITTPDNKTVRAHVVGLAYTANGQSVLFAPVLNSDGLLFAPNQILYPDAFAGGVLADIRLSYTRTGLESDVILRSRLPAPAAWNLNEDDVFLEVWHEFDEAPEPVITPRTRRGETDETLDFGTMRMVRGSVFALDAPLDRMSGAPVKKTWIREGNRTFLIESVRYKAIRAELNQTARAASGGAASERGERRESPIWPRWPPRPERDSRSLSLQGKRRRPPSRSRWRSTPGRSGRAKVWCSITCS